MKIGTRGSDLARIQASWVADQISDKMGLSTELVILKTLGDRVQDRPLREIEGRGYFTKEIESALLSGEIDIAVHSYKDMPSVAPNGLAVAAITEREDPADLLIIKRESLGTNAGAESAMKLPLKPGAIIGTSAVRRMTQLRAFRNDIVIRDLRGNVPTRLNKLRSNDYDAIFLAGAGVNRLDLDISEFYVERLDPHAFIPSPGQGALAVQMRNEGPYFERIRETLNDSETASAVKAERQVMELVGGGCSLPLGVHASRSENQWRLSGFWGGSEEPVWADIVDPDAQRAADSLYKKLVHR